MGFNKHKRFKITSKISNILNEQKVTANKILDIILQQMIFCPLNIRQ